METAFETILIENDNEKALGKIGTKLEMFNSEAAKLRPEERKFLNMSNPLLPGKYKFFMTPAMRVDLFYDQITSIKK